jgi:hypothetical protein
MARCRGCHAEIAFVRLRSGKLMPVESDEAEEYNAFMEPTLNTVRRMLITEDGDVVTAWVLPAGQRPRFDQRTVKITGYESHFASCPNADEFRRGR